MVLRWYCAPLPCALLLSAGCFATSSESPKLGAWKVDEHVGLPPATPNASAAATPTEVVFDAERTSVAVLSADDKPQNFLCRGDAECAARLAPGAHRLGLWSGTPDDEPEAAFYLDVDQRPLRVELSRPSVGLSYAGAGLVAVGLLSMVAGGAGKEADGNKTNTDALLYGGIGMVAVGFGLGLVYWTSGRGTVEVTPLAPRR
jgi:hypothetical protein